MNTVLKSIIWWWKSLFRKKTEIDNKELEFISQYIRREDFLKFVFLNYPDYYQEVANAIEVTKEPLTHEKGMEILTQALSKTAVNTYYGPTTSRPNIKNVI